MQLNNMIVMKRRTRNLPVPLLMFNNALDNYGEQVLFQPWDSLEQLTNVRTEEESRDRRRRQLELFPMAVFPREKEAVWNCIYPFVKRLFGSLSSLIYCIFLKCIIITLSIGNTSHVRKYFRVAILSSVCQRKYSVCSKKSPTAATMVSRTSWEDQRVWGVQNKGKQRRRLFRQLVSSFTTFLSGFPGVFQ